MEVITVKKQIYSKKQGAKLKVLIKRSEETVRGSQTKIQIK